MRTAVAFKLPPRQFVVLNSTTKPAILRYSGEERTVPPRDQYIPGVSAKDSAGNPIPGSMVISDLYDGSNLKFTALDFLRHVFSMDDRGNCSSMFWQKGLSPLDPTPTPEDVAAVDALGRERWKAWEVRLAAQLVAAHDSKAEARQRLQLPALAPSPEYLRAQAVLQATNSDVVAKYRAEFAMPTYEPDEELQPKKSKKVEDVSDASC
jgi:hypothetical protein